MAKLTHGTVLIEVSAAELALLKRGLKVFCTYGEFDDQAELDAAVALRSDLEGVA